MAEHTKSEEKERASEVRTLTPAAKRALAEAEERRKVRDADEKPSPAELGGREGPDPSRYGDWENNGIASDF
ncbi:MAG: DUF1674 domain-containing protein [Pseudomonadota bacterium]